MSTYWRTLDLRPAGDGWRGWLCHAESATDGDTWSQPLVGWLVQEETSSIDDYADTDIEPSDRRRRVVAAGYADSPPYLEAWEEDGSQLWAILGPGEADPTDEAKAEAIASEWRRVVARRERLTRAARAS